MKPEDVDGELMNLGRNAMIRHLRISGPGIPTFEEKVRAVLAAVLPEHEKQLLEENAELATELATELAEERTLHQQTIAERDALRAELAEARAAIEGKAVVDKTHLAEVLVYVFGDDDVAVMSTAARDGLLASLKAALDAPHRPEGTRPVKHIGGRANAEDCPACTGDLPYPWICPGEPESPEDTWTDEPADHLGRSWDPHPFVKSSRVGDNVAVCGCGMAPGHEIHRPEDTREETGHG